ncbi:MAG: hypothetical protein ACP5DY_08305, partial [Thermovirgaceae bacterium]
MGRKPDFARKIVVATVVLWAVAFFLTGSAQAAVSVGGVPEWLKAPITRSLAAVWQEVSQRQPSDRERVVGLVAGRLFPGLDITEIRGT